MSEVEWWRGSVIYRFSPDRLCESDGAGNLPAITAKLDLLADLGVDAISLAPFFDSASQDFFDDLPAEHSAVDPVSGTIEEFDGLLQRAHALGLRVLIDQVWGHTSDVHAWFQEKPGRPDE
jgi:alpha-glucosidase